MRRHTVLIVLLITHIIFLAESSWENEFCVKTAAELQNALTEAAANEEDDIVRVVMGIYYGNFTFDSFEGKSITLLGGFSSDCIDRTLNPANTILDGNNLDRVLFLQNSSGGNIYVEGFMIRKGHATDEGGGIFTRSYSYQNAGNTTIKDNIIQGNSAATGAGIYAWTSNEYLEWGVSSTDVGIRGFMSHYQGRRIDEKTLVTTNSKGDITIINNKIKNNSGDGITVSTGGELSGGFITIMNNLIVKNSGRGVTANSFAGSMEISGNSISENTSPAKGGGAYISSYVYLGTGGNLTIVNNTVTENFSADGGGLYVLTTGDAVAGYLCLINNTITENRSSNSGGGIYLEGHLDSLLNLYNNIIWGNTAITGGDIFLDYAPSGWVESSGFNNNYSSLSGSWTHSAQNINFDPQFLNPANEDYHLQSTSPCIDKGNNTAPNLPEEDFEGDPRIFDGDQDGIAETDIGADEFIGVASQKQTLTITTTTGGTTDPEPGQYNLAQGTEVQIKAIAEEDHRFINWTGDIPSGHEQDNPLFITMDSDKTIEANFIKIIYPPLNASGQKVLNRSLSQAEYINVLTWSANPSNKNLNITKYRIYQVNGTTQTLLIELSANTFQYWHRGLEKDSTYKYAILAVTSDNREGDPFYLIIQ